MAPANRFSRVPIISQDLRRVVLCKRLSRKRNDRVDRAGGADPLSRPRPHDIIAVEHTRGKLQVELPFPEGDNDGGHAVADQVADHSRHAGE